MISQVTIAFDAHNPGHWPFHCSSPVSYGDRDHDIRRVRGLTSAGALSPTPPERTQVKMYRSLPIATFDLLVAMLS
ncbi:hypothetical protein [Rhizobium leguminosarum]|uniref:hypothetical protein n=1 Tax=Rhizobium leguminosarum TaxID=384 RepID=UPI0032B2C662